MLIAFKRRAFRKPLGKKKENVNINQTGQKNKGKKSNLPADMTGSADDWPEIGKCTLFNIERFCDSNLTQVY